MSRARFAAIVPLAVVVLLCVVHGVAAKWEGLGAHCAEELVEPCENGLVCHNATCSFCSSEIPCGQGFACRKEPDGSTCKRMPLYSRFTWQEGVASAIVFLAGGLAAGTGLGGGGIFVPTFVMVAGLNAHEAVPLTKATVLGGAIVNFVLNVQYRHPIVPSRPLIDYSAALLLQPMALAGTVVGAQLNAMTPSWLLLALLAIVLVYVTKRTIAKGVRTWRNERQAQREEGALGEAAVEIELPEQEWGKDRSTSLVAHADDAGEEAREAEEVMLAPGEDYGEGDEGKEGEEAKEAVEVVEGEAHDVGEGEGRDDGEDAQVREDDEEEGEEGGDHGSEETRDTDELERTERLSVARRRVSVERRREQGQARPLALTLVILLLQLLLSLLRGGGKGDTHLIKVAPCSTVFWTLIAATIVSMALITVALGARVTRQHERTVKSGAQRVPGDIGWTARSAAQVAVASFVAGIMGGLLGIGGGMLLSPLLLELGVLPAVAAATSALAKLTSSVSGSAEYFILGALPLDRAVWYAGVCAVATLLGQLAVNALVRRLRSSAAIVFAVAAVLVTATGALLAVGIINTVVDIQEEAYMGFLSPC